MRVRVDFDRFSYGDAVELEEAGYPLSTLAKHFAPKNGTGEVQVPFRLAVVLIWLFRRREEPGLTLEDVMREPLDAELEFEMVGGGASPKAGKTNGASSRSASAPAGRRKR